MPKLTPRERQARDNVAQAKKLKIDLEELLRGQSEIDIENTFREISGMSATSEKRGGSIKRKKGGTVSRRSGGKIMQGYKAGGKV